MEKKCSKCSKSKPLEEYTTQKLGKYGKTACCKVCSNIRNKGLKNNRKLGLPTAISQRKRIHGVVSDPLYLVSQKLKSNYGITLEDYNIIFNSQEGRCKICTRHQMEFKKRLHVDHCHKTGKVRGLLCTKCNFGLGYLNDDVTLLTNAIEYLNKNK